MATNTTVIVLFEEAVKIWAIPPLSPQRPDFSDRNPTTHIPPLFTLLFPDGIARPHARIRCNTISSWFFGSSHPLYFDIFCQFSKLQRLQIILKPDLSSASLHVINTCELLMISKMYSFKNTGFARIILFPAGLIVRINLDSIRD